MSNEEIMQKITTIREDIVALETSIEGLFHKLKKNYPIQPGDKVRITESVKSWGGRSDTDVPRVCEGECTALEIHYDDTVKAICYPYKKDGTVSKTGKIWISHDTTIEKI